MSNTKESKTIYEKYMEKTDNELWEEFNSNIDKNKKYHDEVVMMSGLGVSPQSIEKYLESVKKIDEYKEGMEKDED